MVKNLPANAEDTGSIPGSERSPGEGNGNPFQYFCLENSMDRGAWLATVHGVTKELDMTENARTLDTFIKYLFQLNLSLPRTFWGKLCTIRVLPFFSYCVI